MQYSRISPVLPKQVSYRYHRKEKSFRNGLFTPFLKLCVLFKLAKFDVILIRFSSFSILYNFENDVFSTHYFSFHTLLVPIQYQLFFSLLCVVPVACRSFDYSKNNRLLVCKFTYRNYNLKLLFLQQKVLWY